MKKEFRLEHLGFCGILSLLSYAAMVFISPIAYPGYDWLSMAVSDLSAVGAPSVDLADRLNALFGPCGLVSIMAVCVAVSCQDGNLFKIGIGLFAAMEWITNIGYKMFPLVANESMSSFQNVMHIVVTILVVILSIASLICIIIGARTDGLRSLSNWALICFLMMFIGALGTGIAPKNLFGLFERLSAFSVVIFNCILGVYLLRGDLNNRRF